MKFLKGIQVLLSMFATLTGIRVGVLMIKHSMVAIFSHPNMALEFFLCATIIVIFVLGIKFTENKRAEIKYKEFCSK